MIIISYIRENKSRSSISIFHLNAICDIGLLNVLIYTYLLARQINFNKPLMQWKIARNKLMISLGF